jgi:hypothetical protein
MLNVPVDAPAGMNSVAGTVALVEVDANFTVTPPVPAGPVKVTVPVEDTPPVTDGGETESAETVFGSTVSVAVKLTPTLEAVNVTSVLAETEFVVIVTVALDAPAGIVTVAGIVAAGLFEARLMVRPLAGATPPSETVPSEEVPPGTEVGATLKPVNEYGEIVIVALALMPP